ncbi:hypothetical protein ACVIW0_006190 [Bradyrhizobium sp. USDA 4454]
MLAEVRYIAKPAIAQPVLVTADLLRRNRGPDVPSAAGPPLELLARQFDRTACPSGYCQRGVRAAKILKTTPCKGADGGRRSTRPLDMSGNSGIYFQYSEITQAPPRRANGPDRLRLRPHILRTSALTTCSARGCHPRLMVRSATHVGGRTSDGHTTRGHFRSATDARSPGAGSDAASASRRDPSVARRWLDKAYRDCSYRWS